MYNQYFIKPNKGVIILWGAASLFHILSTVGVGICSAALLCVIRDPKIPKWVDVLAAITLLLLAALFLGMIQSIFNMLPGDTVDERNLKNEYQVALYVIPFFTAGLATNLLSNVILSRRDYTDTMTFHEAVKRALRFVFLAFLASTIVGLFLYVIYKEISKPA